MPNFIDITAALRAHRELLECEAAMASIADMPTEERAILESEVEAFLDMAAED